ncbi:MAG TPA: glycosyltransferase family 39 protein [Chthoniobacterales bacterium]|nr:glycosyltransferase family 39 protein [Chthoniobacterales bacterium]
MTARLGSKQTIWIIGALAAVLFFAANLPWQLDDYDQAKQAYTSFEMVNEGHWLYQHTPHERVATKPPLVGWISAGIFYVTRSWAVAWRLPSLLAAIAVWIVLLRSGNVYGATGGLFAASAFAFNLLTPRLATLVRTDMPLVLAISGIGFLIWSKLRKREQWRTHDRLLLFALLTAAMMIKGPIVYAFLLPGIVMLALSAHSRHDMRGRFWPGWWPWVLSSLIFLGWAIGGSIFVPGFYDQVVVREFLGRFGETIHRPQPLLFYLPHLLQKFFPWSVLMIGIAIADLRGRQWRIRGAFREISPDTLWLIFWIFGGLIVMSIVPSKRVDRIFPVVPPLCLLLAAQISSGGQTASGRRLCLTIALLLSILCAGGYVASKVISGFRDHRDALVAFGSAVRREAAARHWRYEVVKAEDEGLLLYLDKMHFANREGAIAEWNGGNLDALIVPTKAATAFMSDLQAATLSQIKSVPRTDEPDSYILITH